MDPTVIDSPILTTSVVSHIFSGNHWKMRHLKTCFFLRKRLPLRQKACDRPSTANFHRAQSGMFQLHDDRSTEIGLEQL